MQQKLQPLTDKVLSLSSSNREDNACLDMKALGFYWQGQTAFFDVPVLKAPSNVNKSTEIVLRKAKNEKKQACNERVIEIEHGSFAPLVFGANGAMGKECPIYHKKLAGK
eukprot:Seg487.2 transcript_id=Seg487.2/GoldUCD/mRNA.D3Y31 product="hypothetical protein" protein_id=Seg487.2/GoldUCD/D3Y31